MPRTQEYLVQIREVPAMTARIAHILAQAFVLLALAIYLTLGCGATIVHLMDVASIVESSSLIAVGHVTSINRGGIVTVGLPGGAQVSARSFLAALRVDSVLKGNPEVAQLTFEFVVPELPSGGFQAVPNGQYGIFFLRGEESSYKPTGKTYPFLPAARDFEPSPGSPLDQVTSVLGHVLTAPQAPVSDHLQALEALRSLRTDLAAHALRHAMSASAGDMRLYIAAALVARNDLTGLQPVTAALLHPSGLSKYMTSVLGGSLAGLRDPRSVPALSKLIASGNTETRHGAAVGLRQSHSTAALVPLSHALADADVWIRYTAVAGMGEITGQDEWAPRSANFSSTRTNTFPTGANGLKPTCPEMLNEGGTYDPGDAWCIELTVRAQHNLSPGGRDEDPGCDLRDLPLPLPHRSSKGRHAEADGRHPRHGRRRARRPDREGGCESHADGQTSRV